MTSKDSIIFVEPRHEVRAALAQALRVEKIVGSAIPFDSLSQALTELRAGERADVVFISSSYPHEEVANFVSAAKNSPSACDAAFVLVVEQSKRESRLIAKQLARGMDGFLSYPFNVEAVQTSVRVALEVKRQRLHNRVRLASRMLLHGVLQRIDYVAYDAAERGEELKVPSELNEFRALIGAFVQEAPEVYFDVLIRACEASKPLQKFVSLKARAALHAHQSVSAAEIQEIAAKLRHQSAFHRLRALQHIRTKVAHMQPLADEVRRCLADPEAGCRKRAAEILALLEAHGSSPQSVEQFVTVEDESRSRQT